MWLHIIPQISQHVFCANICATLQIPRAVTAPPPVLNFCASHSVEGVNFFVKRRGDESNSRGENMTFLTAGLSSLFLYYYYCADTSKFTPSSIYISKKIYM